MSQNLSQIRLMQSSDYDDVVEIDRKIVGSSRPEYYEMKFEKLIQSKDYLPVSLVATDDNGKVIGFVMGETYMGEYGFYQEEATLDTIGVDPEFQHKGVGEQLINEFIDHLRQMGIQKIYTLVNWNDSQMIQFFSSHQFIPSQTINLERTI